MIALAAVNAWDIQQVYVNNAFLHGYLDEEVYMTPPQGYNKAEPGQVCRLIRSIDGLKQASRCWNQELSKFLINFGFVQSKQDYSMFIKRASNSFSVVVAYVDDLLLTGNDPSVLTSLKTVLHGAFTIKDLGELKYFLGVEVSQSSNGILLNQRKYILDMLKDANMSSGAPATFPLPKGIKLSIH